MNTGFFRKTELTSAAAACVGSFMLLNLHNLLGDNPIGVMFGCVNGSVWESMKSVVLSYFCVSAVELLAVRPPFHIFTAAKALGLYAAAGLFVLLGALGMTEGWALCVAVAAAHAAGFLLSCVLAARVGSVRSLFPLACFMLMFMFIMFISFTAFPPRIPLFMDGRSGRYGIFR